MYRNQQPKRHVKTLHRDGPDKIVEKQGLGTFMKYRIVAEVKDAFICVRMSSDDYDAENKCRPVYYVVKSDVAEK